VSDGLWDKLKGSDGNWYLDENWNWYLEGSTPVVGEFTYGWTGIPQSPRSKRPHDPETGGTA